MINARSGQDGMMHEPEKAGSAIVATKSANKAGQPVAKLVERRAWREEGTVTLNLTLHDDRMMLLLDPTPFARGLVRKKGFTRGEVPTPTTAVAVPTPTKAAARRSPGRQTHEVRQRPEGQKSRSAARRSHD
jgi:hypothetical protein